MPRPDDLADLFRAPEPGPSQEARFRQGTVLSFDPETLANRVSVGGAVLENLPILGIPDPKVLSPGATVGIIPVGKATKTMYIVGRTFGTAAPPGGGPSFPVLCTSGSPVHVCMRDGIGGSWFDPVIIGSGLEWTMPGDGPAAFDVVQLWAENLESVADVYVRDADGVSAVFVPQLRYGLPIAEVPAGYTFDHTDFAYVAPYRTLTGEIRKRNLALLDVDGNTIIGDFTAYWSMSESDALFTIGLERPGLYSGNVDDGYVSIVDPADTTYVFSTDKGLQIVVGTGGTGQGLEVIAGPIEANADTEAPAPVKVWGLEGNLRIGGRHIYAMEGDDTTPTSVFVNDLEVGTDGIPVAATHRVHGAEQGTETVSFGPATSNTTAVPFGTAFAAAPRVFGNIASTDAAADGWTVRCANPTTTGFDLYVQGPSASWSSIDVQWHAIDGT